MVKRLAPSPHDPLGITDSACKNQLVMVSVQYGPFNTNIPIRSTTIGKSRVARDPITMHTSRRSNSDIACVTSIGYPRTKACGESSTTKHRLLHTSGPHPIPPPDDPNGVGKRVKAFVIFLFGFLRSSNCLLPQLNYSCSWFMNFQQLVHQLPAASTSTSSSLFIFQQLVHQLPAAGSTSSSWYINFQQLVQLRFSATADSP
ncbi:carboxyl-terminal-processing peptidase 1, chloroplastic [Dorcoceras hygrometricum]|uniref:Carboxyl-terminal-processing peptidase 1, chloroplastic n=1 Tax=Dorcoceras hygrometricum TaxID=472368 RepID=A0A2Z7B591_9LAMI|nr:carboxyl-terminal-processing peptidase 1, chloroplastic [Dorcoceras hygrometricum]